MGEDQARQTYYFPNEKPKATIALIIINVLLYIVEANFFKDRDMWELFGIGWDLNWSSEWYKLLTAMFTHASVAHVGSNMIALYGAGMYLEEKFGSKRFLIYYLISGLAGEFLGCFFSGAVLGRNSLSIGASGAVFGLFGMLIALSLRGQMFRIPFVRVILFLALSLADGLTESGIDILGHAGGFIVGFIIGLIYSFTTGAKASEE